MRSRYISYDTLNRGRLSVPKVVLDEKDWSGVHPNSRHLVTTNPRQGNLVLLSLVGEARCETVERVANGRGLVGDIGESGGWLTTAGRRL